jgi:putative spermidine/putrescine transport system substrate-binding protein
MARRGTAITVTGAMAALALTACGGTTSQQSSSGGDTVVYINSSGGSPDAAFRKVYWDPFTAATGIKVVNSAPVDNAKLKAMVDSGNVQWDITEIDDGDFQRDIDQGLLAKIDTSKLPTSDLPKQAYTNYGVWDATYSTVLVWDTNKWPMSGKHPTSMMDLWNQAEFPGPRCLQKDAVDNIEWGAIHAGASKDNVYPVNQNQAYSELNKLKKNVAVWWTSGAQSVQAIVNHDCVMGSTWNGRPYALVTQSNAPLGVAWTDAALHVGWWAVPKGAKHQSAAIKLLAYMQDPQRQAKVAEITGYSGGNTKTASFLSDTVKQFLATAPDHFNSSIIVDDNWWSKNGADAEARFTAWLTS